MFATKPTKTTPSASKAKITPKTVPPITKPIRKENASTSAGAKPRKGPGVRAKKAIYYGVHLSLFKAEMNMVVKAVARVLDSTEDQMEIMKHADSLCKQTLHNAVHDNHLEVSKVVKIVKEAESAILNMFTTNKEAGSDQILAIFDPNKTMAILPEVKKGIDDIFTILGEFIKQHSGKQAAEKKAAVDTSAENASAEEDEDDHDDEPENDDDDDDEQN